jgi:S-adenosylmethionine/arginine decarboxylase-like enzyme
VVGESLHRLTRRSHWHGALAESHLAIHTWPEHGFVTVDVFVCNYTTDNTAKAQRLFESMEKALHPLESKFQAIHREGAMPDEGARGPVRVSPSI